MKFLVFLALILFCAPLRSSAQDAPDVAFEISAETGFSSDTVTICRVTATNHSGSALDGRQVGFEALALENGTVVERERGRFGGILRNGEKSETLIGFNGVFRSFDVLPAPVSSRTRQGGSARSRKGASGTGSKKPKKSTGSRRRKNAN